MADTETAQTPLGSQVIENDPEKVKSYLEQLEHAVKRAKECLKSVESASKKVADADVKVAELLTKASESQAKADNEALRASQAKGFVEEHSSAAAKLKGSMEIDASAISKKRAEIESIAQSFTNLRSSSESDATSIANARKTTDEAAKAITETSGKAAATQANITETQKNIDSIAQAVREETKGIEAELSEITAAKETSVNLAATIQNTATTTNELHERAKTAHGSIESLEKDAKTKAEAVNELVEKNLELQQKVTDYEKNLARLQGEFSAMNEKVEGLLPGATSAGLASSFSAQKKRFQKPRMAWMISFFACIGILLLLAIIGGWSHFKSPDQSWDLIWRQLVQRVPYIIPLVWLGVYSGRQYMMSVRMEEEYAYKEAVSTSFEGYKREMASNPESANNLYTNVLAVLARRPGLIYEGEQHDVTPLTPAVDALQKLTPGIADAVAAKVKSLIAPITGT